MTPPKNSEFSTDVLGGIREFQDILGSIRYFQVSKDFKGFLGFMLFYGDSSGLREGSDCKEFQGNFREPLEVLSGMAGSLMTFRRSFRSGLGVYWRFSSI